MKQPFKKASQDDRSHIDSTADDTLGTTAGDTDTAPLGEKPDEEAQMKPEDEDEREQRAKVISIARGSRGKTETVPGVGEATGGTIDQEQQGEGESPLPSGSAGARTGMNSPGAGNTGKL